MSRSHKRSEAETERYIEKISSADDKFDLYVELRAWKRAIEIAVKLRDPYKLNEVGNY